MARGAFSEIDHAADLGLDLTGPDPAAVLEAAQRGLVHVLFGEDPALQPAVERDVALVAGSYPELLKSWLDRLYQMMEEDAFVPVDTTVERSDPAGFRARVRGARVAAETLAAASELKAVTWHRLAFEPDPGGDGWRARVIFDV